MFVLAIGVWAFSASMAPSWYSLSRFQPFWCYSLCVSVLVKILEHVPDMTTHPQPSSPYTSHRVHMLLLYIWEIGIDGAIYLVLLLTHPSSFSSPATFHSDLYSVYRPPASREFVLDSACSTCSPDKAAAPSAWVEVWNGQFEEPDAPVGSNAALFRSSAKVG